MQNGMEGGEFSQWGCKQKRQMTSQRPQVHKLTFCKRQRLSQEFCILSRKDKREQGPLAVPNLLTGALEGPVHRKSLKEKNSYLGNVEDLERYI
jgi:hypothetical protein